ncbi:hypothetical protein D3C85_1058240 [compost metagenome]
MQQRAEQLFVRTIGDGGHIQDARGQQGRPGLRLSHFQQRHGAIGQQVFLRIHQCFCSAKGNHRAHERRWLLIEGTDFDGRTDRHQACQQRVTPGALRHQQAAGTGATLAGGDERRLNDGVHRGIEVGDLIDHQRVVTAHFQRQDLVRTTGELLVQVITGTAGTGEEQTVDARVRRQGDAGFASTLQQVQHAGRQTGLDPALDRQLGHFRRQFAGLEQHAVTRQQCRHDVAVRQVTREVVRTEHRHHTVGLVAQHSGGIAQRAALLAGTFAVALHRDGNLVDHAGDFGRRFPQGFAGFFADGMSQFVSVILQRGGKGFQHRDTLFQGTPRPARERLTRRLHSRLDLSGGGTDAGPQHLLGHRVQRLEGFAPTCQPFTCDVKRLHYFDSRAADNATART